jgi:polyisoprenyl-teichoic acid--peptidoglycan teichoic acid transferase
VIRASRRLGFPIALLAAWIAGSTLGAATTATPARAFPVFQIEPAHAEHVPVLDGSEPIFVLLIGSDARLADGEDPARTRADSIHILAINPAKAKATIVGFPRDAFVPVPGSGSTKINAALTLGGPELVVETVEEVTGLTMDYWALTWFEGFKSMIRGVGGLSMDVPFDVFDTLAGAEITAGPQVLTGPDALAFARARHALPSGDFGRSENQGRLMVAAIAQFRKEFSKDPARLLTWIGAGLRNAQTDVPLDELMTLAFTASTIHPKRVVNIVLPGSVGMSGITSIVSLNQTTLDAISGDLANDGLLKKANVPPSPNASLVGSEP